MVIRSAQKLATGMHNFGKYKSVNFLVQKKIYDFPFCNFFRKD